MESDFKMGRIATLLLVASAAASAVTVTEVDSPASKGSAEPSLAQGADGRVYLSWIEAKRGGTYVLKFATWEESRWSEPRTIAEGKDWFVNWADFPSMAALEDGTLAADWLQTLGQGGMAYGVRVVCSKDGGKTWGAPFWLHRDESATEHGFATLVPLGDRFGAGWLDGRGMADGGPMTLRSTTFDAEGNLGEEVLVDGRVCECCCTGAAPIDGGLCAVWRGRSGEEVRDVLFGKSEAGKWTTPQAVRIDGWKRPG